MKIFALALAIALAAGAAAADGDLCYVPGCKCNPAANDLTDVVCKCDENQVRSEHSRQTVGQRGELRNPCLRAFSIFVFCRGPTFIMCNFDGGLFSFFHNYRLIIEAGLCQRYCHLS